jgi:crossover junction endodeoxyribonuclease RuvC
MIILGIDPGSNITGFGIVETGEGGERLLESGVIRVGTADKDTGIAPEHVLRLQRIHEAVTELIGEFKPDLCAVEMPIYGKNPQSMLKLGRAQAAAMLAALNRQVPVTEYTPKEIKKAVTGNGNASKEQVRFMVETMLQMRQGMSITLDASDALAVALCHIHRGVTRSTATYKNWEAFARSNPGRIK